MRLSGVAQVADMMGVHYETVRDWLQRGLPCAREGAKFDAYEFESADVIQWYVAQKASELPETPKDRLLRLQAEEVEMRIAERRGLLVEATKLEPAMRAAIVSARESLRRAAPRLAGLMDGADKARRIELLIEEFDAFLTLLSQWRPEQQALLDDLADVAPEDDELAA
jgi:phage terminase Nu1 subunit (DNA packaging protein)